MLFPNPTLIDLSKFVKRGNHVLVMIISILVISPCISADNFQYCLRCDDFNRQGKVKCATSYEDCGDCKTGFIQDEEDRRICFAVEILDGPGKDIMDIVQRTGDEVILTCRFNTKVWCLWTKNKKQLVINSSSRYEYLSTDARKTKSDDCSIRIQSLSMEDAGQWQCQSMADEYLDSVKGQPIQISIEHDEDKLIPTIKLDDVNVCSQEIDMGDLQLNLRHKRDSVEQTNTLKCYVELRASDLRWEINGSVIAGSQLDDKRIHLEQNQLRNAFETYMTLVVNLTCLAQYDNGQILTSYVIVHAQHKTNFNKQSQPELQFQESSGKNQLPDVDLRRLLSNTSSFYFKPYQIFMIVIIIVLVITMVIVIIIIIITVRFKKSKIRRKDQSKDETVKLNTLNDSKQSVGNDQWSNCTRI